jgi:predicted membrane-bound spermidine synthase
MTSVATPARNVDATRVALFYAVFFVGGMPALIYQVAWQRVLTLYFGIDIYSTTVTVATFMLGLGVGSLLGGRLADRAARAGLYYAGLELAMGAFGAASLPLFAVIGRWFAGSPLTTVVLIDFVLLLLPTTLMGMTLPLMCRIVVAREGTIGRHLSWLYGMNTMGAAVGALVSAYALIGWFGLDGATRIAAAINVALAAAAYILVRTRPTSVVAAAFCCTGRSTCSARSCSCSWPAMRSGPSSPATTWIAAAASGGSPGASSESRPMHFCWRRSSAGSPAFRRFGS